MPPTSEHIELQIDAGARELWERGAETMGISLAAFIEMAATERAGALISAHDALTLNPKESAWFLDFLRQPPAEPTPAMLHAATLHRELLCEGAD